MRAGYDTFVSDAVERGRASWARYPEINPGEPEHRTIDQAWDIFRFGPAGGYSADIGKQSAYPGMQFPVAAIDQFTKQFVARWTTSDAWIQSSYDALVQRVCPCVIVGHSQAGQFVYTAAQRAPDKVKAVVLVEPVSALDPAKVDPARVKHIPHLTVWGDYLTDSALWQRYSKHGRDVHERHQESRRHRRHDRPSCDGSSRQQSHGHDGPQQRRGRPPRA